MLLLLFFAVYPCISGTLQVFDLKILNGLCGDTSILNAATHKTQLWVHSGTSCRSCVPACLKVLNFFLSRASI